jgi:aspartyl protease family protein
MCENSEVIVNIAIERMKSGAAVKEERRSKLKFALVMSLLFTGLVLFVSYDFVYQRPESRAIGEGVVEVVLKQNREGHYLSKGVINGREVNFLLDTGATNVSVPEGVASKLGLIKGEAVWLDTANGRVKGYKSRISSISLGSIEKKNVRAVITPGMKGKEILLGMSFLRNLSITQERGTLIIRD